MQLALHRGAAKCSLGNEIFHDLALTAIGTSDAFHVIIVYNDSFGEEPRAMRHASGERRDG